jgi:hypothetical protein
MLLGMQAKAIEPNMFDFLPETRRAFGQAAARMRLLSAEKYHNRTPSAAAIVATAEALEAAAKLANTLGKVTVGMHDSWIQPDDMAALARDTVTLLELADWRKLDARANELVRGDWLTTIEEWGKGVVGEEEAA